MRALSPAALTMLAGTGTVAVVAFVEMQLSTPVYLCTAGVNIDWNGHTWLATGSLGSIDAVTDAASELSGLKFTLSGVPSESISLALSENIQGKPCILRAALLDETTHAIIDVQTVWSGTLDQMPLSESDGGSAIGATAEHRGVTMQRPNPLRYTDVDQQRLYPGDRSLEYVVAQSARQDVWPASQWFRQG